MNDSPIILKIRAKLVSIISKKIYCTEASLFKSFKKWIKKINICPEMKVNECFLKNSKISTLKWLQKKIKLVEFLYLCLLSTGTFLVVC